MENYIILALICMFFFGINAILYKIAPKIDPVTLTLISFTVSAIGTFIYWFFFVTNKEFSWKGASIGLVAGLSSVVALITFISALKLGNVSTVNTIRALSVGVTVLLAIIFLKESLSLAHWVGVAFGIVAVVLLSS